MCSAFPSKAAYSSYTSCANILAFSFLAHDVIRLIRFSIHSQTTSSPAATSRKPSGYNARLPGVPDAENEIDTETMEKDDEIYYDKQECSMQEYEIMKVSSY